MLYLFAAFGRTWVVCVCAVPPLSWRSLDRCSLSTGAALGLPCSPTPAFLNAPIHIDGEDCLEKCSCSMSMNPSRSLN